MILNSYTMGMFGNETNPFWIDELKDLTEKHPALKTPHRQDFYTLLFIENGSGNVVVDQQNIKLEDGKALFIKPHTVSSIVINKLAKGTIICFTDSFFSLRYNNNILNQFSFMKMDANPYISIPSDNDSKWNKILQLLKEEFLLQKAEVSIMRSYLNIVLFELERFYNPSEFLKPANLKKEKIHQFEQLILKNLNKKKLPSDYARMLHVTPNYLNKICKEETGITAGNLIRKQIDSEAGRLLKHTRLSVNEIAYKLGFDSSSYFVTFFKKQTGFSPEQFRKSEQHFKL